MKKYAGSALEFDQNKNSMPQLPLASISQHDMATDGPLPVKTPEIGVLIN